MDKSAPAHRRLSSLAVMVVLAAVLLSWPARWISPITSPRGIPAIALRVESILPVEWQTAAQRAAVLRHLPAHGAGVLLVQDAGAIDPFWLRSLQATGAGLGGYVPANTELVVVTRAEAARVAHLSAVRWIGALPAHDRVDPALWSGVSALQRPLTLWLSVMTATSHPRLIRQTVLLPANAVAARRQLDALSRRSLVVWVSAAPRVRVLDDGMRQIDGANTLWNAHLPLYGQGQIVAIADTGLDTGVTTTLAADFQGHLAAVHPLARPNDWSDLDGHGTAMAGVIAGSGVESGAITTTHSYTGTLAGMAPEARLDVQAIADANSNLVGIPGDLATLFGQAYADGARIHNDSWGALPQNAAGKDSPGAYDVLAAQADAFVWAHPDMLIVVAAGNDGVDIAPADGLVDPGSINSPADAKNVLAVGASEGLALPGTGAGGYADVKWGNPGGWGDPSKPVIFTKNPIANSYVSANSNGMAATSSRGPTADGRIKPDLSAPATDIGSDVSSLAPASAYWGPVPGHPNYAYNGGTSLAAAVVSGAAALLREYLTTQAPWIDVDPSAALMKALLLNSAHDMTPGQYGTGPQQEMTARPNSVEGWGRLDIATAIAPPAPLTSLWDDHTQGLTTAQSVSYTVAITATGNPFHATLAWTDYPAAVYAASTLVNDLDLTVTSPDGHTSWGNNVMGGDRVNTVETVDIPWTAAGIYTITVTAHNVPQGPQPYGLAVLAATAASPLTSTAVLTNGPLPTPTPTAGPATAPPTNLVTPSVTPTPTMTPSPVSTATPTPTSIVPTPPVLTVQVLSSAVTAPVRLRVNGPPETTVLVIQSWSNHSVSFVRRTFDGQGHTTVVLPPVGRALGHIPTRRMVIALLANPLQPLYTYSN